MTIIFACSVCETEFNELHVCPRERLIKWVAKPIIRINLKEDGVAKWKPNITIRQALGEIDKIRESGLSPVHCHGRLIVD